MSHAIKFFSDKHKLTEKKASKMQCTAEHLIQRCQGGKSNKVNIAAACVYCNLNRPNLLEPSKYKKFVQIELVSGRWHRFVSSI